MMRGKRDFQCTSYRTACSVADLTSSKASPNYLHFQLWIISLISSSRNNDILVCHQSQESGVLEEINMKCLGYYQSTCKWRFQVILTRTSPVVKCH